MISRACNVRNSCEVLQGPAHISIRGRKGTVQTHAARSRRHSLPTEGRSNWSLFDDVIRIRHRVLVYQSHSKHEDNTRWPRIQGGICTNPDFVIRQDECKSATKQSHISQYNLRICKYLLFIHRWIIYLMHKTTS